MAKMWTCAVTYLSPNANTGIDVMDAKIVSAVGESDGSGFCFDEQGDSGERDHEWDRETEAEVQLIAKKLKTIKGLTVEVYSYDDEATGAA